MSGRLNPDVCVRQTSLRTEDSKRRCPLLFEPSYLILLIEMGPSVIFVCLATSLKTFARLR